MASEKWKVLYPENEYINQAEILLHKERNRPAFI